MGSAVFWHLDLLYRLHARNRVRPIVDAGRWVSPGPV
jgi:hypothetical protein